MNEAGELDPGNMSRRAVDAFEIPDSLRSASFVSANNSGLNGMSQSIRLWIVFVQEATAILFCKDASETPWFIWQRLYVLNIDEK